ncbi:hypothetical protein LCGC14_2785580 [marine sediment metagenome]|uniref:Uncharacterized protein n=1 Tax=marine sediment metagenome TaxID=412755 RepID=A0A0F8YS10_9ZZZZ
MSDLSDFGSLVINERKRQVEKEGWSAEHDDAHDWGQLAKAGAAYAIHHTNATVEDSDWKPNQTFPWPEWDKRDKHELKRRLVIAAALIWAEYDRIVRQEEEVKESEETTFDRQAGAPCPRCCGPMTPILVGNCAIGYRCTKCAEEVEG